MGRGRCSPILLALVGFGAGVGGGQALCARAWAAARATDRTSGAARPQTAPDLPPIIAPAGGTPSAPPARQEEPTTQSEADPLVANGLGSPSCRALVSVELSQQALRNCRLSGFVAASAPTGDYGLDVHIDMGLGGLGAGTLLGAVQDAFVLPAWMALVWAVHALLVAIEWGFSLELLGGSAEAELGRGLTGEEAGVTWPWLPLALAFAGVLVAYRGLIRRRVSDTLGETLLMATMMVGGLWLISDPGGTVGVLDRWSGEMSLGALAAPTGAPSAGARTLADGLAAVFAEAIEGPWCYLEFGDVDWCEDPARLDPRLRAAGLAAAADEVLQAACADPSASCPKRDAATVRALRATVTMLRAARTNGSIFLALPANGAARNSINRASSLLRALCQSSDASNCRGPTAAQAQFRTASGTESRLSGLALIAAGLLGMILLLGYVAVRLVTAASQTLLYLLMAPGLVLSPAFGERGRALFRAWAARLLGAVVSKVVAAFVLGVLLSVSAIIVRVPGLGWWAQWLMLACFWWTTFAHRRDLLRHTVPRGRQHVAGLARPLALGFGRPATSLALRRAGARRDEARTSAIAGAQLDAASAPVLTVEHEHEHERLPPSAGARIGDDVRRLLASDGRIAAGAGRRERARRSASAAALAHQLTRIEQARTQALADGDRRRAIELGVRRSRVQNEIDEHRQASNRDSAAVERSGLAGAHGRAARARGAVVEERNRFLDFQAGLAEARLRPPARLARNYEALAPLAGHAEGGYERLDAGVKRRARLAVDRSLRGRRARIMDAWPEDLGRSRPAFAAGASRRQRPPSQRPLIPGEPPPLDEHAMSDPVMRDLWAVAAGRKRELGIGRD